MAKTTSRRGQGDANTANALAQIAELGGKMPPQALDFERSVLGALLMEHDALQNVVEILKPEHFYLEQHQRIYSAMMRLNTKMMPCDMLLVMDELKKTNEFEDAGGLKMLVSLSKEAPNAVNIELHARIIFQKFLQRSLIHLGTRMQEGGFDDSKDVEDTLQEAESDLFELAQGSMKKDVIQIAPVIADAIKQMQAAAQRKDNLSGLPSGFPGIDKVTSGWQPSTMVVIAARPAMGKTAFVLSMARRMAMDYNVPVAIFSLEMSNVELVKRMLVAETEIPMEKIKNGRLTTDEWQHFNQCMPRLQQAPLFIDDTPGLSVFDLRSKARILHKKHQIKCIIIDYLQLMTAAGMRPGSRQEEVSMISRSLKGLAKELEIPIIALSQLNRNVEQRGNEKSGADGKRPQLSDLRESGAIEQDADMVCFIHRPEYYGIKQDAEGNSLVGKGQFIIAKHRSGGLDDILMNFKAELVRFDDASSESLQVKPKAQPMTSQEFISSSLNTTPQQELPKPDSGEVGENAEPNLNDGAVPEFTAGQGDGEFPF
ncbi:MAG: replicative DNA helicase [Bacteroidales bacterium]|nr:replicative DNA helicase [Bacteroidales bacterium]